MPRSNLADRLMSQTSDGVPVATAMPAPEQNANSAPGARYVPRFEPATGTNSETRAPASRTAAANVGVSQAQLDNSLNQARRFILFRYLIFLASVVVVFAVALMVGAVLIASLLAGDTAWQDLATMGGVEAFSVALLVLLQYRPPRSFASADSQIARLEATRAQLAKSFEFWERFLNDRPADRPVTADDVAKAVSSLAEATNELLEKESSAGPPQEAARSGGSGPAPGTPPSRPAVTSNPRRY